VSGDARADLKLDGRWRQTALREDFTVQEWQPGACGPTPQSNSSGGGEVVSIRNEGDELTIVGGGRVYRSNTCYDPMPNLSRDSHSRDPNGKTWRTRCSTPANDARKALLNTLVVATTDTHIDLIETGRYEITLENGRCMADIKRTRSWSLIQDDAPPATASAPAVPPKPTSKPEPKPTQCDAPGEPSRLEVRPSRKILRTGETFTFRATVLDDKGCATKTTTTWKLAPGENKGVTLSPAGEVTIADGAPEGTVEIIATAAGKDARVTIEIAEPAHYDDLLARSGLNASGENDSASVVSIGTEAVGAGQSRVEDRARGRKITFLAIVGGSLVVLLALALVFLRRTKRAKSLEREVEERHDARVAEVLERRRRRAEEHAKQLRAHEESVAAAQRTGGTSTPPPEAERICPTCGREFAPSKTAFCPHDGTSLVPISQATSEMPIPASVASAAMPPPSKRGKICPTCGERFDGAASFCGKDGTQLVLLN
jgi:hypothetical protein